MKGGSAVIGAKREVVAEHEELGALEEQKRQEIGAWLESLGKAVRPSDRGALSADLSDLYAGAIRYQRMIDRILALPARERAKASDALIDLSVDLWHLNWHMRSARPRLERVADALDPDDA
jgi:hypothetical protein